MLVVCRCFQQWSVEHSHIRRPGSGRPRSTDARQDRRIVRAVVAASREEIRAHVAPAVSPRTIGNRLFAGGFRSRVPLTRLLFTPRHRQAQLLWCRERVDWKVEWRSVVFSDENRFCLYVRDGNTRVQLAKWFAGKRKQPRPGHLLMLSLCGRVIEGVREVTNRWAAEWLQLCRK